MSFLWLAQDWRRPSESERVPGAYSCSSYVGIVHTKFHVCINTVVIRRPPVVGGDQAARVSVVDQLKAVDS